jgi:hypothetical protein
MANETNFIAIPFLNEFKNQMEIRYDIIIPANGATTMNMAVAMMIPELIAPQPNAARKAPENPPINVCEDEDGIPYHHVIRFQVTALSNPAKIMGSGCMALAMYASFTDLAMVVATLWSLKMKNAAKLNNAAQSTA